MDPDPQDAADRSLTPGADLLSQLERQFRGALRFERELGGGGMSRVFLATDPALDRRVVVKVVASASGALSLERFRRELLLAAALHHPHIVPVIATGVVGQLPWYSMPYIEGRSLRDRLELDGALPIRDILRILRDAARACAHAHEHGVVHRDLKPENILLSGDGAMIIDFGIAKAIAEGRTTDQQLAPGITQAGFTLGTPTYMAPEQAAADPAIDHRADIYSLGVVAFELASGAPPFRGANSHDVLRAHLAEPVPDLGAIRPEAPLAFVDLVTECLAKAPNSRPQSASVLVDRLEALLGGTTSGTRRAVSRPRSVVGLVVAFVVLATAVVVGRRILLRNHTVHADASVAVLPFTPRGDDSASRWMASGLSDDITAQLESVAGLRVAARLSVDRLGRAPLPPRELAETLGVRALLDGVVRRDGDDLKVIAQLIDAQSGAVLWTGTYRTDPDSASVVVRQVLEHVREALLPASSASASDSSWRRNPRAYAEYLRGRSLMRGRSAAEILGAAGAMQAALDLDSTFAEAASGLADALLLEPLYAGVPTASVIGPASRALDRALSLAPDAIEPRLTRAQLRKSQWQWSEATADLNLVLQRGPNASAHQVLGEVLLVTGHADSATREFDRARALDPGNAVAIALASVSSALDGKRSIAMQRAAQAVRVDSVQAPVRVLAGTALMYVQESRAALIELREAVRLAPDQPLFRGLLAQGLALDGDRAGARAQYRMLAGTSGGGVAGGMVHASLAIGDTLAALGALEQALREQDPMLSSEPLDSPLFRAIGQSLRFQAVVRDLGLSRSGPLRSGLVGGR